MPQRVRGPQGDIEAWSPHAAQNWLQIKEWSRTGQLVMPCCGTRGLAKQLAHGTRFFAHFTTPTQKQCYWASRGEEYDALKAQASLAAITAGLVAQTEVMTADGQNMIDVLLMSKDDKPLLAVLMQLTRIDHALVVARTAAALGTAPTVLWVLGPGFEVWPSETPNLAVMILPRTRQDDSRERAVFEAVKEIATGEKVWCEPNPQQVARVPFRLVGYRETCTRCKANVAYLPIALIQRGNAIPGLPPLSRWLTDLPLADATAAIAFYERRTGIQAARRVNGMTRLVCSNPQCGAEMPDSLVPQKVAHLWPGRVADGQVDVTVRPRLDLPARVAGFWGAAEKPAPAAWVEPPPQPEAWRRLVEDARRARAAEQERQRIEEERLRREEARRRRLAEQQRRMLRERYEREAREAAAAEERRREEAAREAAKDEKTREAERIAWLERDPQWLAFAEARARFFQQEAVRIAGGDVAFAEEWLATPNPYLGGRTPLSSVRNDANARPAALTALRAALGNRVQGSVQLAQPVLSL